MTVIETDRLNLRRFSTDDAEFILELLNDPSWLRFIGDKGVRTLEDARNYILKDSSGKLLEKVGMQFERMVTLSADREELRLFGWNAHD